MIKFRGIPISGYKTDDADFDGTFVYGNYVSAFPACDYIIGDIIDDGEDFICPEWWVPVDPSTVDQFTGLTDVNGKDIYEGDIVQPVLSYTNSKIGKPFEVEKGNYVYGKWIAKDVSSKGFGVDGYYFSNEIQTVGNVHENPKLMEADK